MSEISCNDCVWFELIEHEYGECRVHPPRIIDKLVGGSSFANLFHATKNPVVSQNHRCSHFLQKGGVTQ